MLVRLLNRCRVIVSRHHCSSSAHHPSPKLSIPPHLLALNHLNRTAIEDGFGKHTYGSLLFQSYQLAHLMKQSLECSSLKGERIVYLTPNDSSNVVTLWAIWMTGAIAVPLCASHPLSEKQYFVDDSEAKLVVGTEKYAGEILKLAKGRSTPHLVLPNAKVESVKDSDMPSAHQLGDIEKTTPALIIYTSGTTGRPKGVVLSHGNIEATTQDMIKSWEWTSADTCLHVLPLHHIHGLVNALHVPLSAAAKCVMLPHFDAREVWNKLMAPDNQISVFTAVPTVYAKLLDYYDSNSDSNLNPETIRQAFKRVRLLMCAGSPLHTTVAKLWLNITGSILKDRYGMTELLTIISNPLHGLRKPGTVGFPFNSVKTMIAKADATAPHGYVDVTKEMADDNSGESREGELYVKGPTVFEKYWNKPESTRETFTSDGWFKTGDTMCIDKDGYYKVLGRTSVDIIKSSGYKISALDIESKLLQHNSISECAILGVPHSVYGQQITALLVCKLGTQLDIDSLRTWCRDYMPPYTIPREFKILGSIPRNAMGKVNKKALIQQYYPESLNV